MKRMIALLLLLCMLTACAAPVPETEEPTARIAGDCRPEQKQTGQRHDDGRGHLHSGRIRALDLHGGSEDAGGQPRRRTARLWLCAPMSFRR